MQSISTNLLKIPIKRLLESYYLYLLHTAFTCANENPV